MERHSVNLVGSILCNCFRFILYLTHSFSTIISRVLFDQRFLFQEVPSEALKQTKALMRLNLSGESPVSVMNVKC